MQMLLIHVDETKPYPVLPRQMWQIEDFVIVTEKRRVFLMPHNLFTFIINSYEKKVRSMYNIHIFSIFVKNHCMIDWCSGIVVYLKSLLSYDISRHLD